MLVYKGDILEWLKREGYNTSRIRKEKLLSESALQYIREGKPIGRSLWMICAGYWTASRGIYWNM